MDASQITKLLQKQNTRYINRCQTVDSSTLIWKNQIESSKYIKGVKTCDGQQNCNVPTNPACPNYVSASTPGGGTQLINTGICSFGGSGRTTSIQTGSPQQFLNVLSGASGSASEVYSSERILLQKAGKESCGVPGLNPITTTTTDICGNTTTTTTDNTYITLPACYCDNTNGPTGPRYNVIGQNPGVAEWATRIGASGNSTERIDSMTKDSSGNVYVVGRTTGSITNANLIVSNYSSVSGAPGSEQVNLSTYGTISLGNQSIQSVFIVKYNSLGQAQWATTINNISSDTTPSYVTIDICGNLYVAGTSTLRGGGAVITINNANTVNPNGGAIGISLYGTIAIQTSNDMFVVKYNSNGQAQAATKINTVSTDPVIPAPLAFEQSLVKGISAGPDGVYVTGWSEVSNPPGYSRIMVYNSTSPVAGVITLNQWGYIDPTVEGIGREVVVAKFNFNLQGQWATLIGNVTAAQEATSLIADTLGNVYVSVNTQPVLTSIINVLNFVSAPGGGGQIIASQYGSISVSGGSSIIVKYNTSGQSLGAAYLLGTGNTGIVFINSMEIDTLNNLCMTGYFQSTTVTIRNFNNVVAGTIQQTDFGRISNSNSGTFDAIIIKYNSNLQAMWGINLGATAARDEGTNITTDIDNNIYVTGSYQANPLRINSFSSITPGSPPTINVLPQFQMALEGITSVYLIKYNSSGVAQWATRQGQTNLTFGTLYPLLVDSNYNIYMAGPFNASIMYIYNYNSLNTGTTPSTVNLGLYASLARQSSAADSFIIKYAQPSILQEIPLLVNNQSNPYLPPFDTYYAMKNPSANCRICPDQNQKHYVKECHTRFPNANNGVNAVFNPSNNVTTLDPVTKTFVTSTQYINGIQVLQPTEEGCILEQ